MKRIIVVGAMMALMITVAVCVFDRGPTTFSDTGQIQIGQNTVTIDQATQTSDAFTSDATANGTFLSIIAIGSQTRANSETIAVINTTASEQAAITTATANAPNYTTSEATTIGEPKVATGDRREAVMYSTQITHALRTAMVSTTTVNYAARATTFPAAIGVAPPGLGQSWSGPIFANPVGLATATG